MLSSAMKNYYNVVVIPFLSIEMWEALEKGDIYAQGKMDKYSLVHRCRGLYTGKAEVSRRGEYNCYPERTLFVIGCKFQEFLAVTRVLDEEPWSSESLKQSLCHLETYCNQRLRGSPGHVKKHLSKVSKAMRGFQEQLDKMPEGIVW